MNRLLPLVAMLLVGCPTPSPVVEPDDELTEPQPIGGERTLGTPVGQPVAVPPQFDMGCIPIEETQELRGTVRIISFGRHGDGMIIDDGDVKWVVAYHDEGIISEFVDENVLSRGQQCEKQGEAIKAYHFEVRSLRLLQ